MLLETRKFDQAEAIANALMNQYFSRYFGQNLSIQKFARELLESGHRQAAREVNQAVNVLG
jgi:hypothetical protein